MNKNTLLLSIVTLTAFCGTIAYAADSPFKGGAEKNYEPPKVGSYIIPITAGYKHLDQEALVKQLNLSFPKDKASEIYNIIKDKGSDYNQMYTALSSFDKNIKIDAIEAAINRAEELTIAKQNKILTIQDAQIAVVKRQAEVARLAAQKAATEARIASEKSRLSQIATTQKEKVAEISKADADFKKTLTNAEALEYEMFKREMTNPAKAQAYKNWYDQQHSSATSGSSDHSSSSDHGTSSDHGSDTTSAPTTVISGITSFIKAVSAPIVNFFKNIFAW